MGLTSRWVVNPMDFMKTVDKSVKDKAKDLAEQVFDGVVEILLWGLFLM